MVDWLLSSMVARENEYYQFRQGLLDQENWESSEKAIRMILGTEFAKNWWDVFSSISFGENFVSYVNNNLIENLADYGEALSKLGEKREDSA